MPATRYTIQPGDTLTEIATKFYKDAKVVRSLAGYNGLQNIDLIIVGHTLEIPTRAELEGRTKADKIIVKNASLKTPNGLSQIISTFGDPFPFIKSDGSVSPKWYNSIAGSATLPHAVPLSWAPGTKVKSFGCHKKLSGVFTDVFAAINDRGLWGGIRTFGGCYSFREKRKGGGLSTHSWAIAVDINPGTNQMGTAGNMDPKIVAVFREHGFKWGGDWTGKSKDPMHFQFCTGY